MHLAHDGVVVTMYELVVAYVSTLIDVLHLNTALLVEPILETGNGFVLVHAQFGIEITEVVMINNMNETIDKLQALKDMGLRVSLDDFGTGYSSLNYLQMLPLNTLKIDKSFINNITSDDGVQANITSSIISMVTKIGLETIAEGVENPEQLNLLNKFNCNIVQGFLQGKPMPLSSCEEYLSGNKDALITIYTS